MDIVLYLQYGEWVMWIPECDQEIPTSIASFYPPAAVCDFLAEAGLSSENDYTIHIQAT